jgi:hypothetical protein
MGGEHEKPSVDFDFGKNPSRVLYVSGTSGQFNLWRHGYARMEKDAEAYSKEIATRISQARFAKYAK